MNTQYSRYYTKLQPIFKSRIVKNYSHIVFSLITIVILSLFAIRPTVKTIISLQNTINEQQGILKKLEEKSANIEAGKQAYDQIDASTKIKLYTLLPSSTAVTCIINDLNYLTGVSQVNIAGLQFQPTELKGVTKCLLSENDLSFFKVNTSKETGVKEITFTFNSQGDYDKLINLLTAVSKDSRLTSIESVNFNQPAEGNLMMLVNGKSYFYK